MRFPLLHYTSMKRERRLSFTRKEDSGLIKELQKYNIIYCCEWKDKKAIDHI